jgi:hypothetical protein
MTKDNSDLNLGLFNDESGTTNQKSSSDNTPVHSSNVTWELLKMPMAYFWGSILFLFGSCFFIPYAFIEDDADVSLIITFIKFILL